MFAFASRLLTVVLAVQRYVTDAYPYAGGIDASISQIAIIMRYV
jgi:hypothetical protein